MSNLSSLSNDSDFQPGKTDILFADEEIQRLSASKMAVPIPKRKITKSKKTRRPSLLLTLALLYAGVYALFVCPYDATKQHVVCRAFDSVENYRGQAISYIDQLGRPFLEHAHSVVEPYYAPAKPYYNQADAFVRPQVTRAQTLYNKQISPLFSQMSADAAKSSKPIAELASRQYKTYAAPFFARYRRGLDRIYSQYLASHATYARKQAQNIQRQYDKDLKPRYDQFKRHQIPRAQKYYSNSVKPATVKAVQTTHRTYTQHIQPNVQIAVEAVISFLRKHIFPTAARFNSVYIKPQINRVTDKFYDRRVDSLEKVVETEAAEHAKDAADEAVTAESEKEVDDLIEELRQEIIEPSPADDQGIAIGEGQAAITSDLAKETQLAENIADKRLALEARHKSYEADIEDLGKRERSILVERLAALRNSTAQDIPARFASRIDSLQETCQKHNKKLARYFGKLSSKRDEDASESEIAAQVRDAESITANAVSKLAKRADSIIDEIEDYRSKHTAREEKAAEKACDAVVTLTGVAQEELGMSYAWLEDVTVKDWTRFHQLAAQETKWCAEFRSLTGAKNSVVSAGLDTIATQVEGLFDAFESELATASRQGIKRLKGESLGIAQDARERLLAIRDSLASVSSQAAASVAEVSKTVISAAGYTATPSNIVESASSVAGEYADSAKSVASDASNWLSSSVADPLANVADLSSASSVFSKAKETILSAAGVKPTPSDLFQSAQSIVADLPSAGDISQAILSAVGIEPSPTDLQQSATSLYSSVASAAASQADDLLSHVSSPLQSVANSIASIGSEGTASVKSVATEASSLASSLADGVSSSASSLSRSLAKAAGMSVPAEGIQEHASSVASVAYAAIPSAPKNIHEALSAVSAVTRSAKQAIGVSVAPENAKETLASVASRATAAASSISSDVQSAAESVRQRLEL